MEVTGVLAAALVIWFGGRWTLQGTVTLGSVFAFLLYSSRFFRRISDMSEKFNVLQAAMASSERIFKLLDTPVKIETRTASRDSRFAQPGSGIRDTGSEPPWPAGFRPDPGPPPPDPAEVHPAHILFAKVSF